MQTASFLKPEHVAPIRSLSLRARLIVEGMIAGLHKSPYHGFSTEFSEFRAHRTGESSRMIDWRKFAKTDRSYVRLHEDETNCSVHLLIDKSASMGFSAAHRMSKFDYARTLAASIAWILIRQRDAVSLAAFDEKITTYLPPHSTNIQLQTILSVLDSLAPAAQTCCGSAIDLLARGIKKRGITILLSDFFDDPDRIIEGLKHLRYQRQDVLCLWILDPQERVFSNTRSYQLNDMETGRTLFLDGITAATFLEAGMHRHRSLMEDGCRELKIDLSTITTDEAFVHALLRVLNARERM